MGRMPARASSNSVWPLPVTPAMPTISPARTWNDTPLHPRHAAIVDDVEIRHVEHDGAGMGRRLVDPQQHPAAHHQLGQVLGAGVGGIQRLHHGALAHDRDAVGDRHDLAQLVGDQDDGLALLAEALEHDEQLVRLLRRQHGRRFVEDQDLGAAIERLEDFDPLLQPDRQIVDQRVGIDLEAIGVAQLLQRGAGLAQAILQQRAAFDAQHDVLQHGEIVHQHEMLMHHADARGDGVLGIADCAWLAVDTDLAGVGLVEAVEDGHQRRFAGAVLADDAVDRAARRR